MRDTIKKVFAVRWQPGQDTIVAWVTALVMIPTYYVGAHATNPIVGFLVMAVFGNGILNVLFPAYYLLVVRRAGLDELGITTRRLGFAIGLSVVWSLLTWKGLQREMQLHPETDILPQLIFNGIILWEPFFVFGWLQLRFERAFGLIPGIVLAAACFAAYHLGTYPLSGVGMLAAFGVVYAVLFRTTKNLLTLWPLTWSVASSIGTMQGGMHFGWDQVAMYAVILIVQLAVIAWMARSRRHFPPKAEQP